MKKNEQTTPRGIRNNNPLNIRRTSTQWEGLHPVQADREFCQFIDMKYGYRAAFRLLMKYYRKYGLHNVQAIINRWAPPNENNSRAYANYVATMCVTRVDRILPSPLQDATLWQKIVHAMAEYENGVCVDWKPIQEGYMLVQGGKPLAKV